MTDLTPFEQRLSQRLGMEFANRDASFDPAAIAAAAIIHRSSRDTLLNRLGIAPLPMTAARTAALVAVAALLSLVMVALAVGLATPGRVVISFIRTNGDVVVAAADGSAQVVIGRVPTPGIFTDLEWAPDGRHIAIGDEHGELMILTASGVVASRRTLDLGNSRFEWSPDGQRLAVLDGPWLSGEDARCSPPLVHPHLEVIAPDGSLVAAPALPQAFRYTAGLGELAWSPNGQQIAIAGSIDECTDETIPSSIWLVDVGQGVVSELTPGGPDQFDFNPTWLQDGRLLFSRSDTGLMHVDPATGATSLVLDLADACPGCEDGPIRIEDVAPDGSRLVLKHSVVGPLVLNLSTGVVRAIESEREGVGGLATLAWSPDGTSVLTDFAPTFEDEPTIVAVDIASGEMKVLVTESRSFAVLD